MITSIHTLIYSDDPPATRAFFRDVLGWPFVEDGESEEGWLIFRTGPSEMGVHPTHSEWEGKTYDSPRHHEISLMCDDVEATRAELEAKGATFSEAVTNVVRHSGATHCEITVDGTPDRVRLTVTDDGTGPAAASSPGSAAAAGIGGTGLKGLTERLATAGGSLEAGPGARAGFQVRAELPVEATDLTEVPA